MEPRNKCQLCLNQYIFLCLFVITANLIITGIPLLFIYLFSDKPIDEFRIRWQIQVKKSILMNLRKTCFPCLTDSLYQLNLHPCYLWSTDILSFLIDDFLKVFICQNAKFDGGCCMEVKVAMKKGRACALGRQEKKTEFLIVDIPVASSEHPRHDFHGRPQDCQHL